MRRLAVQIFAVCFASFSLGVSIGGVWRADRPHAPEQRSYGVRPGMFGRDSFPAGVNVTTDYPPPIYPWEGRAERGVFILERAGATAAVIVQSTPGVLGPADWDSAQFNGLGFRRLGPRTWRVTDWRNVP